MYLDEQYTLYKIAYSLVTEQGFDILHLDGKTHEIWLEKYEYKTSKLVRMIHNGFDWKNHLKRDIAQVFQKSLAMKRLLRGKRIEIYNMYVSSHTPVDDWEALKKPLRLNEKNPLKMKVYYLDDVDSSNELERFITDINLSHLEMTAEMDEAIKEEKVREFRVFLLDRVQQKRKEVENVFTYAKPHFTYILIAINILMFILLEMNGGSSSIDTLIEMGAKYNPSIIEGDWFRIISSMFLHIGFLHLLMNMLAIYYLGTAVERIYGRMRFLLIYFLAGIGGGLASFAFSTSVAAGASGAIFGLFGAILFFGLNYKQIFIQTMGQSIFIILVINIVFGFTVEQIDMGAHIGGLLAGFIASAVVSLPKKRNGWRQLLSFAIYIIFILGLAFYGINNNLNSQSYQLSEIEQLMLDNKYEEIITVATDALGLEGKLDGAILFQRSFAYIQLNEVERAIADLEQSIQSEPVLPEAYYNLALLYYNKGQVEDAKEMIRIANEMKPDDEKFESLYEEINGNAPT